jgi:hypothetical protein
MIFSVEGAIVGEFCGGEPGTTTNNRMELTAVREATQRAPMAVALEIVTDSQLVVGWLGKRWKRNNPGVVSLCGEIDRLRADRTATGGGTVTFRHVRGTTVTRSTSEPMSWQRGDPADLSRRRLIWINELTFDLLYPFARAERGYCPPAE